MNETEQSRNLADVQTEHALNALTAVRSELVQASAVIDNLESEVLPNIFGEFANTLDEASTKVEALGTMTRLVKSLCDAVREKIPIAEPNDLLENVKSLVTKGSIGDVVTVLEDNQRLRIEIGCVEEKLCKSLAEPKMQSDTIRVLELHDEALSYLKNATKAFLTGPGVLDCWKDKAPETLKEFAVFTIERVRYWAWHSGQHKQGIDNLTKVNSDQRRLIDKITKEREELTRKLRESYAEDQRLRDDNERLKLKLEDARTQRVDL